ncbi:MAG: (2Fe-2S) ferredoxin domain-containing protein [Nitrospirota bacterium]|nr:(2Fe-2S) ferredoxin domain-containing protein [Nitrospirota bacterium]
MPYAPGQMPLVSRHVFVCTATACADRGAEDTYRALKKRVKNYPALSGVWVNRSGSVGGCEHGPMVVIYPEGVWYHSVSVERVDELIRRHLLENEVIEDWRFHQTEGCPCMRPVTIAPPF